jgi:hypothetical protein
MITCFCKEGEVPTLPLGLRADVQYSLDKHKRWQLLDVMLGSTDVNQFDVEKIDHVSEVKCITQQPKLSDLSAHFLVKKLQATIEYHNKSNITLEIQTSSRVRPRRPPTKRKKFMRHTWSTKHDGVHMREEKKTWRQDLQAKGVEVAEFVCKVEPKKTSAIARKKKRKKREVHDGINYSVLGKAFGWSSQVVTLEKLRKERQTNQQSQDDHAGIADHVELTAQASSHCLVCFDHVHSGLQHAGCGHLLCAGCWDKYMEVKLTERNVDIECPEPSCKMLVPHTLLRSMLSVSSWEKFQDIEDDFAVGSSPALMYCQNPACSRILRVTPDSDTAYCTCGSAWCVHCKCVAHWPAGCNEKCWFDTNYGPTQHQQFVAPDIKCCPQCFVTIEKNGGCPHMTCRMCKYDFCWTCGSFAKGWGQVHQSGTPCRQSEWHLTLVYNAPNMWGTDALQKAVTYGAICHQILELQKSFKETHAPDYHGYPNHLTRNAIVHAERARLAAAHFLTNTWLMLSSKNVSCMELAEQLQHVAGVVEILGNLLRSPPVAGQAQQGQVSSHVSSRRVQSMAYAMVPLIQNLRHEVVTWLSTLSE